MPKLSISERAKNLDKEIDAILGKIGEIEPCFRKYKNEIPQLMNPVSELVVQVCNGGGLEITLMNEFNELVRRQTDLQNKAVTILQERKSIIDGIAGMKAQLTEVAGRCK